jgi:hypothetical protein
METSQSHNDAHSQLRSLYRSLLDSEDRFHEFKQLLALYPTDAPQLTDSAEADSVREQLNERIREWLDGDFAGLSDMQILLWRSIVVEERFNVALSPWKEANVY